MVFLRCPDGFQLCSCGFPVFVPVVFLGFHMVFLFCSDGFPRFCYGFQLFSYGSIVVFRLGPMVFAMCSHGFPMISKWCSYCVLLVFLLFSYWVSLYFPCGFRSCSCSFPAVFILYPNGFPVVFLRFPCHFLFVSNCVPMVFMRFSYGFLIAFVLIYYDVHEVFLWSRFLV